MSVLEAIELQRRPCAQGSFQISLAFYLDLGEWHANISFILNHHLNTIDIILSKRISAWHINETIEFGM